MTGKHPGLNGNNYKLDITDKKKIQHLYCEQLKSQTEIGKIFDVTQGAIGYFMKKHGIKARTISEAETGKLNPFYGKKHTKKTKDLISSKNKGKLVGEKSPHWKGGFKHRPDGYIIRSNDNKYVHRIEMEKYLGRELKSTEFIHHKDNNTSNNNIENLELTNNSEHRKEHVKTQPRNVRGEFICGA